MDDVALSALDQLPMWVVYDHPRDFPRNFVARLHVWNEQAGGYVPSTGLMVAPYVDMIRQRLQRIGLVKLDRAEDDDPKIMETWI